MRGSVRVRTAAASVLVVGAGVVAASVAVSALLHNTLLDDTDRAAVHGAQDVAALIQAGALPDRLPIPSDKGHEQLLVQVVGPAGRIVSASDRMVGAPVMLPGPPPPPGEARTATVDGLTIAPSESFRVVGLTTATPAGPYTVYAAGELRLVARSDAALRRWLALGGPPFLALVAVVSWLIADRALRGVEGIRAEVDEIIPEALHRRVPEPAGDDEITRLTRTMNEMLERLQLAGERQRRFVADASHELKSPLAAVQADLEVALAHPATADWPATAARLLAEGERMEQLVADLLFLAQCDEGDFSSLTAPAERVDLAQVVTDEVARLGGRRTVPVEVDNALPPGQAPVVAGRPEHLARAVRNLLENAARHARRRVAISLRANDGEVELVVADDGPGIDPADRGRVFDRFTRLDDARGRDEGGTGLGLPIAREIVEAHGGRIAIGDGPGGRLVLRLPLTRVGGQPEGEPGAGGGGLD
ncbi:MAG: HAMP domain-containing histidine kinase, partial [Actinobacteria bacterium]|nr:HAMP domain-containing histidine kinase [Actinomycetota bacterium]